MEGAVVTATVDVCSYLAFLRRCTCLLHSIPRMRSGHAPYLGIVVRPSGHTIASSRSPLSTFPLQVLPGSPWHSESAHLYRWSPSPRSHSHFCFCCRMRSTLLFWLAEQDGISLFMLTQKKKIPGVGGEGNAKHWPPFCEGNKFPKVYVFVGNTSLGNTHMYSQLSLKRTPSGPKLLSGLERCPL